MTTTITTATATATATATGRASAVATVEDAIRFADADHTPHDGAVVAHYDGAVAPWLPGCASYVVYGDADFVGRFTRPMIGAVARCLPRDAELGALVFDRPVTLTELDVDDPRDLTFNVAVAGFGIVIYRS